MHSVVRTTTSPGEAVAVVAICFGWAIWSSLQSLGANAQAGSFSDGSLISLVIMEVICACVALALLRARKYSISSLYPQPSLKSATLAMPLLFAGWLVSWLLVAPFAGEQQPIDRMMQEASVSLPVLVLLAMVNGTYEEVFLLGFLMRGLRGFGLSIAIGVPLLIRLVYHLYQGPVGALSVVGFGLVLSIYYAKTGSLFTPVFAHVLADIVPFVW